MFNPRRNDDARTQDDYRNTIIYKIAILGPSKSGKSRLTESIAQDSTLSNFDYTPTIGVEFNQRLFEKKGQKIKLQLWDTAGNPMFGTITKSYIRGPHIILVVLNGSSDFSDNKDQLLDQINMINTYASNDEGVKPPVVIISTHQDKPHNTSAEQLKTSFAEAEAQQTIVDSWVTHCLDVDLTDTASIKALSSKLGDIASEPSTPCERINDNGREIETEEVASGGSWYSCSGRSWGCGGK